MVRMAVYDPEVGSVAPASLYHQVRWARLWLPLLIVAVVLLHQLVLLPMGGETFRFWGNLLFYALLGPSATFLVLNWIAKALKERERAQRELQRLYRELAQSFERLRGLQHVTERFAAASDLKMVVDAAVSGGRGAVGARATALVLRQGVHAVDASDPDLARQLEEQAQRAELAYRDGGEPPRWAGGGSVLAYPLVWGGRHEGSFHALFDEAPDTSVRETFAIVANEFANTVESVQARTRDLLTLFEVDRSIRAEGNLNRLLDSLLRQMLARADAAQGGVFLLDEDQLLNLRAAVSSDPVGESQRRPVQLPIKLEEGPIGQVAAQGSPLVLGRVEMQALEGGDGSLLQLGGSALLLPLRLGEGTIRRAEGVVGVVALTHPAPEHFDETRLPFLALLASQVALAVRNADAYLQSEELAIVEERARIAREIHDGVAQSLAFAALKLDLVSRLMQRDTAQAEVEVLRAKETIREMIREVRRSIFALRPVDLERFGLLETVRRYAIDFGQQNDVKVELRLAPAEGLSLKTEAVLFRIFQEAMHNVAKHAKARQVHIRIEPNGVGAELEVRDDGVGFDLGEVSDRVSSAGSLGLRQMRERVEGRGGVLEISSQKGAGTRVHARVPA
jgi:signal transduction histidine kinase